MQHLRISSPRELTPEVLTALQDDPAVTSLSCVRGASLEPEGDVVEADVAREAMNDVVDRLRHLGVHRDGTIHIQPVVTWLSQERARRRAPDPRLVRRLRWSGQTSPSVPTRSPS